MDNLNKTRKNGIVEYLDYQIPVTQLKGPKGNGDMQAAKLLSDTRYSAKGTKGKWRYASSKARLKCATYRALEWAWQTFVLDQSIGIDETKSFQLKKFSI